MIKRALILAVSAVIFVASASFAAENNACPKNPYKFEGRELPNNLFYVEKNDNINVAFFDLNLLENGSINPKNPVVAYWLMFDENAQKEDINFLEKRFALGIDKVEEIVKFEKYKITLNAIPKRPITIIKKGNCVWAEVDINKSPAILGKLRLDIGEPLFFAKLTSTELFGKDIETGTKVDEIIYYKKPKETNSPKNNMR